MATRRKDTAAHEDASPALAGGGLLERVLEAAPGTVPTAAATPDRGGRIVAGHVVGVDAAGRLLFRPDGSEGVPMVVAVGTADTDERLRHAASAGERGVVALVDAATPILLGLVRERLAAPAEPTPDVLTVRVDGEALAISARQQIELRCGKASLLLRADGQVVLSGTYVVSTSRGPNKIRGATVTLN